MEFIGIYSEDKRKSLIQKENKRLCKVLDEVDERTKLTVEKLINEIAFIGVTLDETKQIIIRDGIIEMYQNGATQSGIKKSAAVEVYDKLIKSYSFLIKQVNDKLPNDTKIDAREEIMSFALDVK